jgi:hypothetical protein
MDKIAVSGDKNSSSRIGTVYVVLLVPIQTYQASTWIILFISD